MKRLYMVCNIKSTFNNLRDFRVQMAASVAFILIVLIYKRCRFKYDDKRAKRTRADDNARDDADEHADARRVMTDATDVGTQTSDTIARVSNHANDYTHGDNQ